MLQVNGFSHQQYGGADKSETKAEIPEEKGTEDRGGKYAYGECLMRIHPGRPGVKPKAQGKKKQRA